MTEFSRYNPLEKVSLAEDHRRNKTKKTGEIDLMVKIRLKRLGYKKNPTYRIVVINDLQKREGKPICELGHYNPKTKEMKLDKATALDWISKGAKPTETVQYLINNCDDEGKLIYKQKTEKKLSKKALAKLEAEKEAQAAAAEAPAEEAAAE